MISYLKTPVLLIIFNRPETTRRVFGAIRQARPTKLFIAADGPRSGNLNEKALCDDARKIAQQIDWPCEVKTFFKETNLGCGKAVSGAIDWFFENEEEGIILEDDCLPTKSFFNFCQSMLNEYRTIENVSLIAGTNFLFGTQDDKNSYFFSNLPLIWGWATWRRTWQKHRSLVNSIYTKNPSTSFDIVKSRLLRPRVAKWINRMIEGSFSGKIDTWDAQFTYSIFKVKGLTITPFRNQISNIGLTGTHSQTKHKKDPFLNMSVKELDLKNLIHPLLPPNTDWTMDHNSSKMIEKYALGGYIGLIKDNIPIFLKNILKNTKRKSL